jgi:hypothetical protein
MTSHLALSAFSTLVLPPSLSPSGDRCLLVCQQPLHTHPSEHHEPPRRLEEDHSHHPQGLQDSPRHQELDSPPSVLS